MGEEGRKRKKQRREEGVLGFSRRVRWGGDKKRGWGFCPHPRKQGKRTQDRTAFYSPHSIYVDALAIATLIAKQNRSLFFFTCCFPCTDTDPGWRWPDPRAVW